MIERVYLDCGKDEKQISKSTQILWGGEHGWEDPFAGFFNPIPYLETWNGLEHGNWPDKTFKVNITHIIRHYLTGLIWWLDREKIGLE